MSFSLSLLSRYLLCIHADVKSVMFFVSLILTSWQEMLMKNRIHEIIQSQEAGTKQGLHGIWRRNYLLSLPLTSLSIWLHCWNDQWWIESDSQEEVEKEREREDGLRVSSLCLQRTRLSCVVFIFCMLMMMMMMPKKMISYSTKHRYTDIPDYSLGLMKKGKKRERISNEWMTFEVKREEKLFAQ